MVGAGVSSTTRKTRTRGDAVRSYKHHALKRRGRPTGTESATRKPGTAATAFIAINSRTNSEVGRQEPTLRHANQGTMATSFVARSSCSNGEVDGQEPTEGDRNRTTSQTLRLLNQGTAATCCVAIGSRANSEVDR